MNIGALFYKSVCGRVDILKSSDAFLFFLGRRIGVSTLSHLLKKIGYVFDYPKYPSSNYSY